jgi:hypothetical protein
MTAVRRCALVLLVAAAPRIVAAQAPSHAGAFVIQLGRDTTAVERFSRSGESYGMEQVLRSPRTSLRHTHLQLTPGGDVATLFLMHHQIGKMDAPLLGSTTLTYAGGDSATVESKRGDTTETRRVAVPPAMIPSLPQSFLPYELAGMRFVKSGADSMTVTLVTPSGDRTSVTVRRIAPDSLTFTLPFLTYRARVDAAGRILSLYQPLGTSVRRVAAVDINRIAGRWSRLDAAGKPMGALSPLDSSSTRLGPATISLKYSRPRVRGRTAFGGMAPWDTIWRTGANAASILTTDRDVEIGGTLVPAGSYSLFTINSRTGSTLIINRETTRDGSPLAGTDYNSAHDLARIPMRVRTLASTVEPFTIEVRRGSGDQGVLRMAWARREMTVSIWPR